MSAAKLGVRGIVGRFFDRLAQAEGASWVGPTSMLFQSDQLTESYNWLGQSPAMREWLGGRQAQGWLDNSQTITNLHFEGTVEAPISDFRRDKTGQLMIRVGELAQRAQSHWASLLSAKILAGPSTTCFDGQFFFDTDHAQSGTSQSNDITVDISALPAATAGVVTAPSPEEAQQSVLKGIAQILGFTDDKGEPVNESAGRFLVMVPTALWFAFDAGLKLPRVAGTTVQGVSPGIDLDLVVNPRLTWTDSFAVFRTDGDTKPFIRQEETPVQMKTKGENSDSAFDSDIITFGIDSWRNVGYGYWDKACFVVMT